MKVKLARVIHEEILKAFAEIALKTLPQTLNKFVFTVKYLSSSQEEFSPCIIIISNRSF